MVKVKCIACEESSDQADDLEETMRGNYKFDYRLYCENDDCNVDRSYMVPVKSDYWETKEIKLIYSEELPDYISEDWRCPRCGSRAFEHHIQDSGLTCAFCTINLFIGNL